MKNKKRIPLEKRFSFFKGLSSIFNIFPDTDYNDFIEKSSSQERISSHWEKVGKHFNNIGIK